MGPRNDDDRRRAALLAGYLFCAIAGLVTGKAGRDALFLSHFPARDLAAFDALTALLVTAAVCVQLRLAARASAAGVVIVWPLVGALVDLALWTAHRCSPSRAVVAAAFVCVGAQSCFSGSHAALVARWLMDGRAARRLCGIVGSAALGGWIAGGLVTQLVARDGAAGLLLASGACAAACSALAAYAARRTSTGERATAMAPHSDWSGLRSCATRVLQSPHLRALAALAFVSAAMTTIAGLQFRTLAGESLRDSGELAAFFGSFTLRASLVALACQLLLTTRVLASVGVGAALAVAPAALGGASVALWYFGTFTAAIVLKGTDHALRYSIDRSAIDLTYRPLTSDEALAGRTVIDAVVSRCGDMTGSLLALAGTALLHLSVRSLTGISLALCAVWLIIVLVVRRRYGARLLAALREAPAPSAARSPARHGAPALDALLDSDGRVRLAALRTLSRRKRRKGVRNRVVAIALGAEIVGFAMLVDQAARLRHARGCRAEGRDAIERIGRLLYLREPDRFPTCILAVDDAGRVDPTALDYLDTALPTPQRRLLVTALERWGELI